MMWPPKAVQASLKKTGILHRSSANDDVAQTAVDVLFDRVQITNPTAELNGNVIAHRFEDGLDRAEVLRFARKGAVQIHQVQATCPFFKPAARHGGGIFTKGRGLVHVALFEANTVAVFEVNGGDQNHGNSNAGERKTAVKTTQGCQWRKLRNKANPCAALFSG
jgi:hypothetical protein